MSGKKGLGKGFESLIPTGLGFEEIGEFVDELDVAEVEKAVDGASFKSVPLAEITPDPDQPRKNFDEEALLSLSTSIREHGVLQPIVVVPDSGLPEGAKYRIIAGERRWRASKIAGLSNIPALVRTENEQKRLELSLIENIQRENLNAIETAFGYLRLKEIFGLETAQIAQKVGKSEAAVTNTLRLLNLPEAARHAMVEHKLTEGQMRPLISASPSLVARVLPLIINEGLSARKVEEIMAQEKAREAVGGVVDSVALIDDGVDSVRELLSDNGAGEIASRIGFDVAIKVNQKGAGQMVIKFKNAEEMERLKGLLE